MTSNKIQKNDIQFTSHYFAHGLASIALSHGIAEADTTEFARMVLSRAREMIVADPRSSIVITTASGKSSVKEISDKAARSKVTGSGVTTKLTIGETKSAFIGESLGADLARIDQSLAALEKLGCGICWAPAPGSGLVAYLERLTVEFKAQRPERYHPVAAESATVTS